MVVNKKTIVIECIDNANGSTVVLGKDTEVKAESLLKWYTNDDNSPCGVREES